MKKLLQLYKKADDKRIIKQYINAHVLFFVIIEAIILGFSKKSLEIVRLAADNKVLNRLRKKYKSFIKDYLANQNIEMEHICSNKVWVCWLQGMENAPNIVKKCYKSLQDNLKDKEIVLITDENYKEYVTFPEYIQEKVDRGIISKTHFSDLLRLELLIKYGGTWIDATVFCSGNNYPEYIFNSDLFVFQTLKPGLDGHATRISSWFMSSYTNNPILLLTRALLYEYWKNKNRLIDYFLLHDFFELAIESYPEEWQKVIPFSNSIPHILLLRLFEEYDENTWKNIKRMTCIHKLSYKFDKENIKKDNTYFKEIIGD